MSIRLLRFIVLAALLSSPATAMTPLVDINRAIVFGLDESVANPHDVEIAKRAGADVILRGWFKWCDAPDFVGLSPLVDQAHAAGQLFGGGVTCSALFERENGLDHQQVMDMSTRDVGGQIVNAMGDPRARHGAMSNPRYIDYVLSWCYKQIDQKVDCIFMDEQDGALGRREGFDDYAKNDFRAFLIQYGEQHQWRDDDRQWRVAFKIDLTQKSVTADGTMRTFDYRGYLAQQALTTRPYDSSNPLAPLWQKWMRQRNDRVWKQMLDRIHAYADAKGQRVFVSGNGLAQGADLQVLGVWKHWLTKDGKIDFSQDQLPEWAAVVAKGHERACRRVPVVFFQDWGANYPWMDASVQERTLYNRIRGAEMYAAGAFYAFPIRGVSGPDAMADGTLDEIARQSAFYHTNRSLYLDADLRSVEAVQTSEPLLSVSLWSRQSPPTLIVHVVNRNVVNGQLQPRARIALTIPTDALPRSVTVISPDWAGEQSAQVERANGVIKLILTDVQAYSVALLKYDALPKLALPDQPPARVDEWGNVVADRSVH